MNLFGFVMYYFGVVLMSAIIMMSLHYLGIKISDKYRDWFFVNMTNKDFFYYSGIIVYFPLLLFEALMGLFKKEERKWKHERNDGWVEIEVKKVVEAVKNK